MEPLRHKKVSPAFARLLKHLNLPKFILDHMFGTSHPKWHRLIVGALIMLFGAFIADLPYLLCHCAGGFIHALGAVPGLDAITEANIE